MAKPTNPPRPPTPPRPTLIQALDIWEDMGNFYHRAGTPRHTYFKNLGKWIRKYEEWQKEVNNG